MFCSVSRFAYPALALVLFCGCSRNPYGGDAVVSVDGTVLFSGEIDLRAANIAALFLHHDGTPSRCEKVKKVFSEGYPARWVEDRVLEREAERVGVALSEGILGQCRRQAFQNFKAKGDKGYEALVGLPGMTRELWEDQVKSDARRVAMREYWAKESPTNIPMSYADGVLAKMKRWNADMAETNRLQWVKATNVWQQLNRGADFVKTARLNTELPDEIEDDCEWGSLDDQFLEDEPALRRRLAGMKAGEWTPPVDADGGILIVRLDERDAEGAYRVSRIFFRKANFIQPAPRAEIIRSAEEKYVDGLFERRLGELVEKADVRYFANNRKENNQENKEGK